MEPYILKECVSCQIGAIDPTAPNIRRISSLLYVTIINENKETAPREYNLHF